MSRENRTASNSDARKMRAAAEVCTVAHFDPLGRPTPCPGYPHTVPPTVSQQPDGYVHTLRGHRIFEWAEDHMTSRGPGCHWVRYTRGQGTCEPVRIETMGGRP